MDEIFQEIELLEGESSAKVIVKIRDFAKKEGCKNSGYKWDTQKKYWYKNYYLNIYSYNSNFPNNTDNNIKMFIDIISHDSNIEKDLLEVFLKQLRKSVGLIPPICFFCNKIGGVIKLTIEKPNLPDKMMKQYGYIWQ